MENIKENTSNSQIESLDHNLEQILKEDEEENDIDNHIDYPDLKDQASDNLIDFQKDFFPSQNDTNKPTADNIPKLFVNDQLIQEELKPTVSVSKEEVPSSLFSPNEQFDTQEEKIMKNKETIENGDYEIFKSKFFGIVTSQNGSRFMQRVYLNSSREICEKIFEELLPQLNALMTDPYANYFCPKLYSTLSQVNKLLFLKQLSTNIIQISKSKKGIFSLQSVLDLLKSKEEKVIIVNALSGNIIELCLDEMGVHLVEKVIICFEEDLIMEVYDTIINNFALLAQNPYGLFVCKKIIICARNFCTLSKIRNKIKDNSMLLIKNQYGNYTIQVAVENWPNDVCQPLIESFSGNFFKLSMEKYSSNVIEKCLEKSDEKQLSNFIEEISINNCIVSLIKNSYGNYVMQKALKLSSGKVKTKFITVIKKNLEKLNDEKLISKWKGIINNTSHLNLGNGVTDLLNLSGSSNNSCNSNRSSGFNNQKEMMKTANQKYSKSNGGSPFLGPLINSHSPIHYSLSPMQLSSMAHSPHSPIIRSPIMAIPNKILGSPIMNPQFIQYPNMIYQQFPRVNNPWGLVPPRNFNPYC